MNFVEQLTAISLLIDFLLGVTFGVVGVSILGSRREDCEKSLLGAAPDPFSAGARIVHGVYTRDDGYLQNLLPGGGGAAANPGGDDTFGPHGQQLDR